MAPVQTRAGVSNKNGTTLQQNPRKNLKPAALSQKCVSKNSKPTRIEIVKNGSGIKPGIIITTRPLRPRDKPVTYQVDLSSDSDSSSSSDSIPEENGVHTETSSDNRESLESSVINGGGGASSENRESPESSVINGEGGTDMVTRKRRSFDITDLEVVLKQAKAQSENVVTTDKHQQTDNHEDNHENEENQETSGTSEDNHISDDQDNHTSVDKVLSFDKNGGVGMYYDFVDQRDGNLPGPSSQLSQPPKQKQMPSAQQLGCAPKKRQKVIETLDKMHTTTVTNLDKRTTGRGHVNMNPGRPGDLKIYINVDIMAKMLMEVLKLKNGINPFILVHQGQTPFSLEAECYTLINAMTEYVDVNSPTQCATLFPCREANDGCCDCGRGQGAWKFFAEKSQKPENFFTWLVATKDNLLTRWTTQMSRQMGSSLPVHPPDWCIPEMGFILGFWMAKLFNVMSVKDENLPEEILLMKQRFIELHGKIYGEAEIYPIPEQCYNIKRRRDLGDCGLLLNFHRSSVSS